MINMISRKNKRKIIQKERMAIKIFIALGIITFFNGPVNGQIEPGNIRKDSTNQGIRVKLNSRDSTSDFVPLSKINPEDIKDTVQAQKKIPGRAGLYSAILPGLGQAYNGNYWKIPIIYSLFATVYFVGEDNNHKFQTFKKAYEIFDDGETVPGLNPNYTKDDLKEYKDYYKRSRDLNIIIGVAIYFLNILDASVDAHLMDYDISEDLSLKISPEVNSFCFYQNHSENSGFGIKFVLSLH
jgi:hypothetical protein